MTSTMLRVLAMATSLLVYSNVIDGATRSMRLVSSLHGGSGIAAASTKSYPDMTPRVAPRDYVGPPLLANLTGVCVNHLTAK